MNILDELQSIEDRMRQAVASDALGQVAGILNAYIRALEEATQRPDLDQADLYQRAFNQLTTVRVMLQAARAHTAGELDRLRPLTLFLDRCELPIPRVIEG